jgi:hypothetical protein
MASAVATMVMVEQPTVATAMATVTGKETAAVAAIAMEEATMTTPMAAASPGRPAIASAAFAAPCGYLGAGTQRHDENDTVHAEYLLRTEKENQPMLLENTCHRLKANWLPAVLSDLDELLGWAPGRGGTRT